MADTQAAATEQPKGDVAPLFHPGPRGPTNEFEPFREEWIERSVPERFAEVVARYPERVALRGKETELTFDELNRAANRLAHAILEKAGEGREPVALFMEHDAPMIVAIFGVLKSGRAYAPMAASFPPERIRRTFEETEARLVVVSESTLPRIEPLLPDGVQAIALDRLNDMPDRDPEIGMPPETFAAILFTSGSTGRPKGVVYPHRNILYTTWSNTNAYHVTREDRVALFASYTFGASIYYIFFSLLNGARLCVYNLRDDGIQGVGDWLRRERITLFHMVPTAFRQFAATLDGRSDFPDLRLCNIGAETVTRNDVELYRRLMPDHCLMRTGLGTAETNSSVTRFFFDKQTEIPDGPVPIGYPAAGMEVLLLDDEGRPVPDGDEGELVVRSKYLSPGYWRRPDLTEDKFRPDPERPDERLYFTGDLGSRLPDGCLFHHGRKDFQVKIRGVRIEPGEIQAVLLEHESVRDAVVVARKEGHQEAQLFGYVVADPERPVAADELKRHVQGKLPDYMIPAAIVALDSFPVTANGKLDRAALPRPTRPDFVGDNPFVPARTRVERQLAKIWTEVLDVPGLGVTDNFFYLGGNSLSAAWLFTQVDNVFGVKLALATLMNAPTIERMARVLEEEVRAGLRSLLVPIKPDGSRPPLFCVASSDALAYLYLGRVLDADQPLYALHPLGGVDLERHTFEVPVLVGRYADEVCRVQPEGPYLISGMCYGGIMAYELACELIRRGRRVALLALLDTPYPWSVWQRFHRPARVVRRVWTALRRGGPRRAIRAVRPGRRRPHDEAQPEPADTPSVDMLYWDTIPRAYRYAFKRYRPGRYPGDVTLLLGEKTPVGPLGDRRLVWRKLAASNSRTVWIPGDHEACLIEPNVRITVARLNEAIDAALAEAQPAAAS